MTKTIKFIFIIKQWYRGEMNDQQILLCISLHSPERMTVNHDVTGSSPVGGAKRGS